LKCLFYKGDTGKKWVKKIDTGLSFYRNHENAYTEHFPVNWKAIKKLLPKMYGRVIFTGQEFLLTTHLSFQKLRWVYDFLDSCAFDETMRGL
jgi:hypothetical protein